MYFKMRSGMGDIIVAPLYRVLRARGVQFRFYHRVTDLIPGHNDAGRPCVERVRFERLVDSEPVEPVSTLHGVLTWPALPPREPFASDAEHADACHADRYFYAPRTERQTLDLHAGSDFDHVVFAIPVGAIPYVAPSLLGEGEGSLADDRCRELWRRQTGVEAVQTLALQLWFRPELTELGWRRPEPLLSLYYDPLNTYCSMDQTLDNERGWPPGSEPGHVAYFCGALRHRPELGPISVDVYRRKPSPDFERQVEALTRALADEIQREVRAHLDGLHELFPRVAGGSPCGELRFNYGLLIDPSHRVGGERLAAQYLRANHEPWERCTLALPGTTAWRLRADDTGYANLAVAGDWIANGFNAACLEGAFVSGIFAARAVSGSEELYPIAGERLLNLEPRPAPARAEPRGGDGTAIN
jgi:hypothetical protein